MQTNDFTENAILELDNQLCAYITKGDISFLLNNFPSSKQELYSVFQGLKRYFITQMGEKWVSVFFVPDPSCCKTREDYELLFHRIEDKIPPDEAFEVLFKENINQLINTTYSPENYIQRIVDLFGDTDCKQNVRGKAPSLRVKVLRQLIKYTYAPGTKLKVLARRYGNEGHLISPKFVSEIQISDIDESIFAQEEQSKEYKIKQHVFPKGSHGYTMITAANNFAESRFDWQGITRLWLYIFAFAFDLRFYPTKDVAGYDHYRDFAHLINDYYTDNLIRDLDLEYTMKRSPSGISYNFKNIIEAVFLLFLDYRNNESRHNRFIQALDMLGKIKNQNTQGARVIKNTGDTKNELLKLFDLYYETGCNNTSDLIEYLSSHFTTKNDGSAICLENEEKTPALAYIELMANKEIHQFITREASSLFDKLKCLGLNASNDVSDLSDSYILLTLERLGIKKTPTGFCISIPLYETFILPHNTSFFNPDTYKKMVDSVVLDLASEITRTDLIQAFFWKHLYENKSFIDGEQKASFWDVYNDFGERTEATLEKCGYAPINEKSIYDMITLFILHYLLK